MFNSSTAGFYPARCGCDSRRLHFRGRGRAARQRSPKPPEAGASPAVRAIFRECSAGSLHGSLKPGRCWFDPNRYPISTQEAGSPAAGLISRPPRCNSGSCSHFLEHSLAARHSAWAPRRRGCDSRPGSFCAQECNCARGTAEAPRSKATRKERTTHECVCPRDRLAGGRRDRVDRAR